jgi:beta-lactamase superfamily II metal-dependent hydrolase
MNSKGVFVELHLFACGSGDTILLKLADSHWVLVDCYLPEDRGIREDFFAFVDANNITRLDFIFQTHPDFDHYHGMIEVLRYFTSGGRSVGYYCDGGINAAQIRALLSPANSQRYGRLHAFLDELAEKDLIRFYEINDQHGPISPAGFMGRVDLVPIAPSADLKRQLTRSGVARLGAAASGRDPTNALSVVLMLAVKDGAEACSILLAADADPEGLGLALLRWEECARQRKYREAFRAVKVPHHGSIHSHIPALCSPVTSGAGLHVAAVSAGTRSALPARQVLEAYLNNGWQVMLTTTRGAPHRSSRPFTLANRGPTRGSSSRCQNIRLTWTTDGGLHAEPTTAEVRRQDLPSYDQA